MLISLDLMETLVNGIKGKQVGDSFQIEERPLAKTQRVTTDPNPPVNKPAFKIVNIVVKSSRNGALLVEIPDDVVENWL